MINVFLAIIGVLIYLYVSMVLYCWYVRHFECPRCPKCNGYMRVASDWGNVLYACCKDMDDCDGFTWRDY